MSSSNSPPRQPRFLHLKFFSGRPPTYAARVPFAHDLKKAIERGDKAALDELPDGLKTDVQREGIARYLRNNFREGTPVHAVLHEREADSKYIMVNANWHRSVGDTKLHLSLYVYEKDKHVETWHAYTDRSLSLDSPAATTNAAASPAAASTCSPTQRQDSPDQESSYALHKPRHDYADNDSDAESIRREQIPSVPSSPAEVDDGRGPKRTSRSSSRPPEKRDTPATTSRPDWDAPPPSRRSHEDVFEEQSEEDWIKPPPESVSPSPTPSPARRAEPVASTKPRPEPVASTGQDARRHQQRRKDPSPIVKSQPLGQLTSRDRKTSRDRDTLDDGELEERERARHGRGRSLVTRNRGMNFGQVKQTSVAVVADDDRGSDSSGEIEHQAQEDDRKHARADTARSAERPRPQQYERFEPDLEEEDIQAQVRRFEQELREKAKQRASAATKPSRPQQAVTLREESRSRREPAPPSPTKEPAPPSPTKEPSPVTPRASSRYRQPSRARSARSARPVEVNRDDNEAEDADIEVKRAHKVTKHASTRSVQRNSPVDSFAEQRSKMPAERPRRHRSVSRHDRHPSDDSHEDSFDPEIVSRPVSPTDDTPDKTRATAAATATAAASTWFSNVSKSVGGLITKAREANAVKHDETATNEDRQDQSEDEQDRRQRREERRRRRAARRKQSEAEETGADTDATRERNERQKSRSRPAREHDADEAEQDKNRAAPRAPQTRAGRADPLEDAPVSPLTDSTARPRRKSFSATVGAGIQSLRDTVTSAVNSRLEATERQIEADLVRMRESEGRHRSKSRRRDRRDGDEPRKETEDDKDDSARDGRTERENLVRDDRSDRTLGVSAVRGPAQSVSSDKRKAAREDVPRRREREREREPVEARPEDRGDEEAERTHDRNGGNTSAISRPFDSRGHRSVRVELREKMERKAEDVARESKHILEEVQEAVSSRAHKNETQNDSSSHHRRPREQPLSSRAPRVQTEASWSASFGRDLRDQDVKAASATLSPESSFQSGIALGPSPSSEESFGSSFVHEHVQDHGRERHGRELARHGPPPQSSHYGSQDTHRSSGARPYIDAHLPVDTRSKTSRARDASTTTPNSPHGTYDSDSSVDAYRRSNVAAFARTAASGTCPDELPDPARSHRPSSARYDNPSQKDNRPRTERRRSPQWLHSVADLPPEVTGLSSTSTRSRYKDVSTDLESDDGGQVSRTRSSGTTGRQLVTRSATSDSVSDISSLALSPSLTVESPLTQTTTSSLRFFNRPSGDRHINDTNSSDSDDYDARHAPPSDPRSLQRQRIAGAPVFSRRQLSRMQHH
ncbi:hypothetical protein ACM66B_002433 [Microbotryomycetes sp. NB124-2]